MPAWLAIALMLLGAAATAAPVPDFRLPNIGLEQTQDALFGICAGRQPERAVALRQQLKQWQTENAEARTRLTERLHEIDRRQRALVNARQPLPVHAEPTQLLAARMQGSFWVLGILGPLPDAQIREHCERWLPELLKPKAMDEALEAAERYLALLPPAPAPDGRSLLILVRHAEKAAEPAEDPPLSEAGQRRAQALATALADAGIRHIVTTQWKRTQETARPLAQRLGLLPRVVETRRGADHGAELAALLRELQGPVLVVGHSNTLTPLLAALGGPRLPLLCESSHAQLFVWQAGSLLRLQVGEPDPPAAPGCL